MALFPHLKFIQKVFGKARIPGGGTTHPQSSQNQQNRRTHSNTLSSKTSKIKSEWSEGYSKRDENELAPLEEKVVPIFLKFNPQLLKDVSFDLQTLGIEIISEEIDGYIIGASLDDLRSLKEKINGFSSKLSLIHI